MEQSSPTHTPRLATLHLTTVDSTNNFLRQYRAEVESDITLVTADYQTAGRGQRGNSWESEVGKNVVYSLLIHPRMLKPMQFFSISEIAAMSVCEALEGIHHSQFSIKWPNDIYYGDKKIAGILIETDLMGGRIENAIIGVGVNINQQTFLSDAPNPISLFQIIKKETPVKEVMTRIMERFDTLYQELERGEIETLHQRFMQHLYRREGYHAYRDEKGDFEARITGVELSGHLHLEDREGIARRYAFKEVSYLI